MRKRLNGWRESALSSVLRVWSCYRKSKTVAEPMEVHAMSLCCHSPCKARDQDGSPLDAMSSLQALRGQPHGVTRRWVRRTPVLHTSMAHWQVADGCRR